LALKDELDRNTASFKKEIRDLQKQLETVHKVEQKQKSTGVPLASLLNTIEYLFLDIVIMF